MSEWVHYQVSISITKLRPFQILYWKEKLHFGFEQIISYLITMRSVIWKIDIFSVLFLFLVITSYSCSLSGALETAGGEVGAAFRLYCLHDSRPPHQMTFSAQHTVWNQMYVIAVQVTEGEWVKSELSESLHLHRGCSCSWICWQLPWFLENTWILHENIMASHKDELIKFESNRDSWPLSCGHFTYRRAVAPPRGERPSNCAGLPTREVCVGGETWRLLIFN